MRLYCIVLYTQRTHTKGCVDETDAICWHSLHALVVFETNEIICENHKQHKGTNYNQTSGDKCMRERAKKRIKKMNGESMQRTVIWAKGQNDRILCRAVCACGCVHACCSVCVCVCVCTEWMNDVSTRLLFFLCVCVWETNEWVKRETVSNWNRSFRWWSLFLRVYVCM